MDLPTLISWRATCRALYTEVCGFLRRALHRIISPFFSHPLVFLEHLSQSRAVIGGIVALSFVLRDPYLRSDVLQLYAGCGWYNTFVDKLVNCGSNARDIDRYHTPSVLPSFTTERDIHSQTVLQLKNGRRIVIYRAKTASACSPVCRSPFSVFNTFVTEHSFGCGYPRLTLQRRSILSDLRLGYMDSDDEYLFDLLCRSGFTFAVSPTAWSEFRRSVLLPVRANSHLCARQWNVCPMQGRYFGDKGSFVDFLDPLSPTLPVVRSMGIPPFGPMVAWRLHTSLECAELCDVRDPVLHEWLVSTPLLILPNPYSEAAQNPHRTERGRVMSDNPTNTAGKRSRSL
ncbi:hypothetical protein C8Q76DRAFT_633771 [Earliella scabrosa]|nr:hypothetical protein C8Q76DRAFT_633771 [Earliella scabrosa]